MTATIKILYGDTAEPMVTINRAAGYKQIPASAGSLEQIITAWTAHLQKLGYTVVVIR